MSNNSTQKLPFSLKLAASTLQHKANPDGLYVEDILATFGTRSHAMFVLFFTLPFVQPVPMLGLSTPFGMLLFSLGFLVMTNKPLWMPKKILRRHLSAKITNSCCDVLIRILNKTERFIKPRFSKWTSSRYAQILNGFLIMLFAFLLALPIPIPFSNSVPAWFLVVNALGELEEDGLLMGISYVMAIAGIIFFLGLGLGAQESFLWLKEKF